jgi:hypothetical protein
MSESAIAMDFTQLDQKHKRAVISHVKFFRVAVERLSKLVPAHKRQALLDEISTEARDFINFLSDQEVDEIIKTIETNLNATIK